MVKKWIGHEKVTAFVLRLITISIILFFLILILLEIFSKNQNN